MDEQKLGIRQLLVTVRIPGTRNTRLLEFVAEPEETTQALMMRAAQYPIAGEIADIVLKFPLCRDTRSLEHQTLIDQTVAVL